MTDVYTNGRTLSLPAYRFIGRPGTLSPLDQLPANALGALEKLLDKGLPNDRAELAKLLARPIWSHDGKEPTLFKGVGDWLAAKKAIVPISNLIDHLKLTTVFLEVSDRLKSVRGSLDPTARQLLDGHRVVEYLYLRACLVEGLDKADGILRYLTSWSGGLPAVHGYTVRRSVEDHCEGQAIKVDAAATKRIIDELVRPESPASLSQRDFLPRLKQLVQEYVRSASKLKIIDHVKGTLGIKPEEEHDLVPALVQYLNGASYITMKNAALYLGPVVADLRAGAAAQKPAPTDDRDVTSADYSVDYYADATASVSFDQTSVEAAAQLFYVMTWGDELGVFEVIDRIAAQRDPHLRLSIRKHETAQDLSTYVFDHQFLNLKTGKLCRRVDREERQMYYRQVFGAGDAPVGEGMEVNTDFPTLWGVLMNEVKDYIVRTEEKQGTPSRQRVYQAIEDLQYSISAACSGMAKVAAPVMYREMDFVIRRLLGSEDFTTQLSKEGPASFMKVIENVRGVRGLNPLRNKGMIGHQILSTIAAADPSLVEDSKRFDTFIGAVEAYIVTLGQMGGSPQRPDEVAGEDDRRDAPPLPGAPGTAPDPGGKEWSF